MKSFDRYCLNFSKTVATDCPTNTIFDCLFYTLNTLIMIKCLYSSSSTLYWASFPPTGPLTHQLLPPWPFIRHAPSQAFSSAWHFKNLHSSPYLIVFVQMLTFMTSLQNHTFQLPPALPKPYCFAFLHSTYYLIYYICKWQMHTIWLICLWSISSY